MVRKAFALTAVLVLSVPACATLPADRVERALYVDARKVLNAEHRVGWTVDRVEIEQAAQQVEPSACQVSEARRQSLLRWLRAQIAAEGGPARLRFQRGEAKDELEELIDLEQALAVLENVESHLPEDCAFWVAPDPKFTGLHRTEGRFLLIAESMGAGSMLIRSGAVRVAGGGSARILGGYGLSSRLELAAGVEGGGDAVLENNEKGSLSPAGAFRFGVPIWLRLHDLDRIYDVELAAISRVEDREFKPWGLRVAVGGGLAALRRLGVMPALQLWLGYEVFPAQGGNSVQHALRLGTRVGFDYAL